MKFDLNASKKVKYSTNAQGFWFKNQGNYILSLKILPCIFLKRTHLYMYRNEAIYTWAIARCLLPYIQNFTNFRSTLNSKKRNKSLMTTNEFQLQLKTEFIWVS